MFTKHPNAKGLTYIQHAKRAGLMGIRLLLSAMFFIVHSLFPFIPIPRKLNCHDMVHALVNVARWTK